MVEIEPVVWIVDREQWPRACLRAELIERGFDARAFETLSDAVEEWPSARTHGSLPSAILLELRDQALPRRLLVVLRNMRVPVFCVGGAVEHEAWVRRLPWAAFVARPVSLGELADLLARAVGRRTGEHPSHPS